MDLIIDNGHGIDTPGKRSPDGRLLEWAWTRDIASRVAAISSSRGIKATLLVPEERDVPLRQRVARANLMPRESLLLSIHVNAAGGDGQWHEASGFAAYVCPDASGTSRNVAKRLVALARGRGLAGDRWLPTAGYWEQDLAICRDTRCPAVLAECLFQDNRQDMDYLLSDPGRIAMAQLLVDAVLPFLKP